MGTAINQSHIARLIRTGKKIIFCLDNDNAGIKATKKVCEMVFSFYEKSFECSFVKLPFGIKDPDELLNSSGGVDAFMELISKSVRVEQMYFDIVSDSVDFKNPNSVSKVEKEIEAAISVINNKSVRFNYSNFFFQKIKEKRFSLSKKSSAVFSSGARKDVYDKLKERFVKLVLNNLDLYKVYECEMYGETSVYEIEPEFVNDIDLLNEINIKEKYLSFIDNNFAVKNIDQFSALMSRLHCEYVVITLEKDLKTAVLCDDMQKASLIRNEMLKIKAERLSKNLDNVS
jgi:DNA primase